MSLDQTNVIDALGFDNDGVHVALTIADAWDWSDERSHLLKLQDKINAYLEFVESKQIYEEAPKAKGLRIRIDVVFRYEPTPAALDFLSVAARFVRDSGYELTHRVFHGRSSPS